MSIYLDEGLPQPVADELDQPFWQGLKNGVICLQRCKACQKFQWGPEWICHRCHGDDLEFSEVAKTGKIYSYERVWHPVHPALSAQGPYLIVLVEMAEADNVRLVGNLLGNPHDEVTIGSNVEAVFEHHEAGDASFTLLQWQCTS